MTDRDPALEPCDALIGTWATDATHPQFDAVVPGSITFELIEGGHFLVQRSHDDHELFPARRLDGCEVGHSRVILPGARHRVAAW